MSVFTSGLSSFINRNVHAKTALTLAMGVVLVSGITGFTHVVNEVYPDLTTVSATYEESRTVTVVDVEPVATNTITVSGSGGTTLPAATVSGSAGVNL
jgi:DNA-binding beta-propeller fold protein YncE